MDEPDRSSSSRLGVLRCAALLADLTGLDVSIHDVSALAAQGHIPAAGKSGTGRVEYDAGDVRRLAKTEDGQAVIAAAVDARVQWMTDSVSEIDACRMLGWSREDLERVAAGRGIREGRFRRWRRADIEALAADENLNEQVRQRRLAGPEWPPQTWGLFVAERQIFATASPASDWWVMYSARLGERVIYLGLTPQGGHAFIPVGSKDDAAELCGAMIEVSGVNPKFVRVRQLGKCREEALRRERAGWPACRRMRGEV